MNRRRLGALAATLTAAATLLVTTSATADAAGTCSARVTMPAKIVVNKPSIDFNVAMTTNCTGYKITADLTKDGSSVLANKLVYTPTAKNAVLTFKAAENAPGVEASKLVSGTATNGTPSWISTAIAIKYGTEENIASTRVGTAVYINALVKSYDYTNAYIADEGRPIYVQRYSGGAWHTILQRTANSAGRMTVGFTQPSVYQYRVVSTEVDIVWGGTSASTFK